MGNEGNGEDEKTRFEKAMRVTIIPRLIELNVIVNPKKKVSRKGLPYIVMPWMFAPWPDCKKNGVIEIEVKGETLRTLLTELSDCYKKKGVDFEPIHSKTNDIDFDYDISVNGKNYFTLPHGLDTKLRNEDDVKIKMLWRWDG